MTTLPITKVLIGAVSDDEPVGRILTLPYEVGALLFTEGFWKSCKANVKVRDKYVFNGPFEAGRIEPDELTAFAQEVGQWSSRYKGGGTVRGVYSGTADSPRAVAEVPAASMRDALLEVQERVREAKLLGTFIYIIT
jgi:hypothetical protein